MLSSRAVLRGCAPHDLDLPSPLLLARCARFVHCGWFLTLLCGFALPRMHTACWGAQSLASVPDAAELQVVWPHNMQLGRARNDDVIRLEAWGAVDVAEIQSSWASGGRLKSVWLYSEELLNLVLVELSYRERAVRQVAMLIDAGGMTTAHKALAVLCLREVRTRALTNTTCFSGHTKRPESPLPPPPSHG